MFCFDSWRDEIEMLRQRRAHCRGQLVLRLLPRHPQVKSIVECRLAVPQIPNLRPPTPPNDRIPADIDR